MKNWLLLHKARTAHLSAVRVAVLQALLNDIGGKLMLAYTHHLPMQLLNDFLPAPHINI